MRSLKIQLLLIAIIYTSLSFAEDSSVMKVLCEAHQKEAANSPTQQNNCDSMIIAMSCSPGASKTFSGAFNEDKRALKTCVKEKGKSAKTELALVYHPGLKDFDTNAEGSEKAEEDEYGVIRQPFTSRQLQQAPQLKHLRGSLIIAQILETPELLNMMKIIDAKMSINKKYKDKSQSEKDKIAENILIGELRERHWRNMGKEESDPNLICKKLDYDKAEISIISRNVIPAITKKGKAMKSVKDTTFWGFTDPVIEIEDTKEQEDDEKVLEGYRFFEKITCVKLKKGATSKEEDRYDKIESELEIANHKKFASALTFESDPYNVHEDQRKEALAKQKREPAVVKEETWFDNDIDQYGEEGVEALDVDASIKPTIINV